MPFTLATTMGLVALAADLPISTDEATNGLVAVAAADFLLGKAGVALILTILFMVQLCLNTGCVCSWLLHVAMLPMCA